VRQLRQSAWQVDMNARRINTSRAGRALAEQRLEAEQKRFEVGMSTTFLVVQAQRDLAQAEQRASGRARVREGRHRIRDAAGGGSGGGHHDRGVHGHHDCFREHREREYGGPAAGRVRHGDQMTGGAGPAPVDHTTTSSSSSGISSLSVISTPK